MAAPLLAGGPQPSGECPLADPVAPRDLGLAPLAPLVGVERPLAQVGGVGTRHRSSPVGVKATSTADRGAGSVDGHAICSSAARTVAAATVLATAVPVSIVTAGRRRPTRSRATAAPSEGQHPPDFP